MQIERVIDKFGTGITDMLFHTLVNMKKHGKKHGLITVNFNIPDNKVDSEGTLTLTLHEVTNSVACFNAIYTSPKKYKEICPSAINVAKDLHILINLLSKLPSNPPMRNKSVFTKKELYRKALIDQLKNNSTKQVRIFVF